MVNPILLVAVPLGVAFLLPLVDRLGRAASRWVHFLTLVFYTAVSASWALALHRGTAAATDIITANWPPPIGINLHMGLPEAVILSLAGITGLCAALFLAPREEKPGIRSIVLQVLLLAGTAGLTLTRDIFNMFVFLEITSIATFSIVLLGKEKKALEAGFKYMILGGIASVFLLLGIAFLYKTTGTLNMADMAAKLPALLTGGAVAALVFLFVCMVIELKGFPLNGPAIDLYEGVEPGVMALIVGTTLNATLFAFWKILPLFQGVAWEAVVMTSGMTTFVLGNLFATRQKKVRRMLGYSSAAQVGLLVFLLPLLRNHVVTLAALGLLLLNHTLAKASLLWFTGIHEEEETAGWKGAFRSNPFLRILFGASVLAIAGLPPFPGFWGKWYALAGMARSPYAWWILPLLAGSLLEFVYYFRWLRETAQAPAETPARTVSFSLWAPPAAFTLLGLFLGIHTLYGPALGVPSQAWLWMWAGGVLLAASFLPERVTAVLSFLAVLLGSLLLYGAGALDFHGVEGFFTGLVALGAVAFSLARLGIPALHKNYHGLFLLLAGSLLFIVKTGSLLGFFAGWELMTWTSYFLVRQGKKGPAASYLYILFSGAAGFLLLGGLMVASGAGAATIAGLAALQGKAALWTWILVTAGLAVKVGSWGVHIWAPESYSEAPDVFTPFLSGVISKIPVFAFAALAARLALPAVSTALGRLDPAWVLGWLGGITAFGMTLLAIFQDDMKKLLAYSSLGQVGYIVLGLALMTPLGWTAAFYHSLNHLLFKGLLFVTIAGVIHRTGTRSLSDLGGLITRMPFSFFAVLIGIIALAGVPPLSGFAGKWLLYQAGIQKGWYLLTALAMFASILAFPYLFKLIHSIFLGQLKREHREIREAPKAVVLTQWLLIAGIFLLSVAPGTVLGPIQAAARAQFGKAAFTTSSATVLATGLGYFHSLGTMAMVVILAVIVLAGIFFFLPRHTTKIKQLDIVYAGEVPPPPEEIQFAWNFFRPFERAYAPLLLPRIKAFWKGFSESVLSLAEAGRRLYTGDGQTYILYALGAVLFLVLFVLPAPAAPRTEGAGGKTGYILPARKADQPVRVGALVPRTGHIPGGKKQ